MKECKKMENADPHLVAMASVSKMVQMTTFFVIDDLPCSSMSFSVLANSGQRLYAVVTTSPTVIVTVRQFIGIRKGGSRSVNHGYHGFSAVCDANSVLLGKEE